MKIASFIPVIIVVLSSCIRNDIPYPSVVAEITELKAEGAESVTIDAASREVLITLGEAYDLSRVNITSVGFNDRRVASSGEIAGIRDLSSPLVVTLRVYDEYSWTIRAEQSVTRIFAVTGQIGEATIDADGRSAVANVAKGTDLKEVSVTALKLGPEGQTVYSPSVDGLRDFSVPRKVSVSYRDVVEEWTLSVSEVELSLSFDGIDAWTGVAWLRASGPLDDRSGFRIRKSGENDWREVGSVTRSGISFSAMADALEPLTRYECCAYVGDEVSEIRSFITEAEMQLPNSGFETVSHAESDKYFSFYDPEASGEELRTKWWGSGNSGATTLGGDYAVTMPDESDKAEGERSLKMMSRYIIIKFAAGNVFSGEYSRTIGISGGVIRMGRPFSLRPRKLSLSLKYKCGKIDRKTIGEVPDGEEVKAGDNDRASVWIALGDWDCGRYGGSEESPVEVNTTDKSTFFDPKGENVIAYGRYIASESIEEWTRVEIPLEYVSTSRRPTHIIVSCAASMLGDYFTGSRDSILWVDDLKLEY